MSDPREYQPEVLDADTVYVVEKRHSDGLLDFSDPQPPWSSATGHTLLWHFWKTKCERTTSWSASWEEVFGFYNAKGWYIRRKTW